MSKTERLVRAWVNQVAGGPTDVVSWIELGYPTNPSGGSGRTMMADYLVSRGLDPERQLCRGHHQMFVATTASRLLIGSVGGMLTVKPKELLVDAPLAPCRVEWWDQSQLGPDQRHLLFVLDEGWVPTSARIDERSNADPFIASLGRMAVHVRP